MVALTLKEMRAMGDELIDAHGNTMPVGIRRISTL